MYPSLTHSIKKEKNDFSIDHILQNTYGSSVLIKKKKNDVFIVNYVFCLVIPSLDGRYRVTSINKLVRGSLLLLYS